MKSVAIYNFKGGAFKSTATYHIAAGLALRGKRVLVVDTDPQAHCTQMFGVRPRPALHDFLVRKARFQDVAVLVPPERYTPEKMTPRKGGYVAVIGGDSETTVIPMKLSDPLLLRKRLEAVSQGFDVFLFDTAPTPSLMSAVIYLAADYVLYPTKCEALHIDGLNRALEVRGTTNETRRTVNLPNINVLGILPAIYRYNTLEHAEYRQYLIETYGQDLVWKPIPDRIIWAEASREALPVFAYAPGTKAARDAWEMVIEFERRLAVST